MAYVRNWRHKKDPYLPPDYDENVIYAVRSFRQGVANEGQQKLLWDYLAYLGGVGDEWQDLPYRPGNDGDRDTVLALGKQFPIFNMRKLCRPEYTPPAMNVKPEQIKPKKQRKRKTAP